MIFAVRIDDERDGKRMTNAMEICKEILSDSADPDVGRTMQWRGRFCIG